MRAVGWWVGGLLLVVGIALVAYAVATGGAHLYLVLIFPVVAGASPAFAGGVLALIAGLFLIPFLWAMGSDGPTGPGEPSGPAAAPASPGASGSAGLVLVGPVPIFLGGWRKNPPLSYGWAVLVAVALFLAVLLVFWLWFSR